MRAESCRAPTKCLCRTVADDVRGYRTDYAVIVASSTDAGPCVQGFDRTLDGRRMRRHLWQWRPYGRRGRPEDVGRTPRGGLRERAANSYCRAAIIATMAFLPSQLEGRPFDLARKWLVPFGLQPKNPLSRFSTSNNSRRDGTRIQSPLI